MGGYWTTDPFGNPIRNNCVVCNGSGRCICNICHGSGRIDDGTPIDSDSDSDSGSDSQTGEATATGSNGAYDYTEGVVENEDGPCLFD